MPALLNLNLDRFREPTDIDGPTAAEPREWEKDDMLPQSTASQLEMHLAHKLTGLRHEAEACLGQPLRRYSLEYGVSTSDSIFQWQASIVWGKPGRFVAEVGSAGNLDNAISSLLAKLPAPVDLASIMGYSEQ